MYVLEALSRCQNCTVETGRDEIAAIWKQAKHDFGISRCTILQVYLFSNIDYLNLIAFFFSKRIYIFRYYSTSDALIFTMFFRKTVETGASKSERDRMSEKAKERKMVQYA